MRALGLDFRHGNRGFPLMGALLLLMGAGASVSTGLYYQQTMEAAILAEQKVREAQHSSRRQLADTRRTGGDLQKVNLEVKRASEVLMQLNQPWDELFQLLESSDRKLVALLSIDPDPQNRQVKVTAEAKDLASMLGYVRYVQEQGGFSNVFLQSHQVQQQDPEKPVRFVVTAAWMAKR